MRNKMVQPSRSSIFYICSSVSFLSLGCVRKGIGDPVMTHRTAPYTVEVTTAKNNDTSISRCPLIRLKIDANQKKPQKRDAHTSTSIINLLNIITSSKNSSFLCVQISIPKPSFFGQCSTQNARGFYEHPDFTSFCSSKFHHIGMCPQRSSSLG